MAPFDAQYLNPDGSLNLAAIYSSGGAGDAAQAAQGGGQYRDYGNVTGPSMYTSEGDPGSTPAYWGGSPFGVGGQQAYDPAAHGGATNPYAASLLAQLGSGGAGGAAAGWLPNGGGAGGAAAGWLPNGGGAGGAAAGWTGTPPWGGGGGERVNPGAHANAPWTAALGPEYYDPNRAPPTALGAGSGWVWRDGRWQIMPNQTPVSTTGGPGQPPSTFAEQGPNEAGIYPGGAVTPAATTRGGNPVAGPAVAPVQLGPAALVNAPAPSTQAPLAPAPSAVIRRLTAPKIAAPVGQSTQSSGLINWR